MIELVAAITIMCSQYPYYENSKMDEDVYYAVGEVFSLVKGEKFPSSKEVNQFCYNYELNNQK